MHTHSMRTGLHLRLLALWVAVNTHGKSLGEMYTSVMSIKQSSLSEIQLIHYLRTYIDHETRRLEDVKRFYVKVSEFHDKIYSELAYSMANPLVAFSLIKRLQSEWLNVVYSSQAKENLEALRTNFESLESSLPRLEDLQGAAQGLMRLQDVYALHVEALVKGHFQRNTNGNTVEIYKPSVTIPLSGDDCFLVGKVAYEAEDYYHAVQWLEEAVSLFGGSNWSLEHDGSLEEALDHLAFSYYKTGNISSALSLSLELLHHDPSNKRVLLNLEKYKKLLTENPPIVTSGSLLKRPNTTYLRTRDTYERLCQTHRSQVLTYNPQLFCDYFTNDSPGLYLQPIRREVLSVLPYVVLFHNFVMGTEAQSIRDSAVPGLRRSVAASGVNQTSADYRISKSAWLKDSTHPVVGKVNRRITLLTGLNVQHPYGEHLQVVNYGIGGHYEPHYDHATSKSSPLYTLNSGNRMATFMIYLSSVEAGGSTAFIHANLSVPAVENSALFWWNLHRNGQGDGDTLHAGCPVLLGDKWVANKWVHEYGQEFQRRCSRDPDE
uniref:Prolyl 4-hydroxylase subunit alpha-3 n=1 Tax=Electrophorus electricus TaxID=8005 RepID=A0A4W4E5K1_ELEEL